MTANETGDQTWDPEALARRLAGSGTLLVLVNLAPVVGVLYLDWDVFRILSLFWLENVFIGLFGIARLVAAGEHRQFREGLFVPLFFLVHYGGFMAGHGFMLLMLFSPEQPTREQMEDPNFYLEVFTSGDGGLVALALLGSHAWSFFSNFLGGQEHRRLSRRSAMALPYRRMMITHVALLVGGFWLQERGQPLVGLILLVAMKLVMDLVFHLSEHRRLAPPDRRRGGSAAR